MLEAIIENNPDEEFLTVDGFNDAIIGFCEDCNSPSRIIYSVSKCLEILVENEEMDEIDAMEHLTYNVIGAYVGEKTPVWCWDINQ